MEQIVNDLGWYAAFLLIVCVIVGCIALLFIGIPHAIKAFIELWKNK